MTLETAGTIADPAVTESRLKAAFADDQGRGGYIILSRSGQVYIQAAGEGEGPYSLEYRDGDNDRHFTAGHRFTKREVERLFLHYLTGDERRRPDVAWVKMKKKPWWKRW